MASPQSLELPPTLQRVHMVGIGGAGMSGLARILLARGAQVSGTDAKESRGIADLRKRGAAIQIGHSATSLDLLDGGPTVVVSTHAAIPRDNPELIEAARRGIDVVMRPVVLAQLMAPMRTALIAGTHGKTSTTSMAVVDLQHCGLDPSFAVGGELNESGTNAHHGTGSVFVAEADESDGSLLEYRADIVVVTNVDADHLDHFGSIEAYVAVFDEFFRQLAPGATAIVCLDDPGAALLAGRWAEQLHNSGIHLVGYGRGVHADLAPTVPIAARISDWQVHGAGSRTTVELAPRALGISDDSTHGVTHTITVGVPGIHMALNATGAVLAAIACGASVSDAVAGMATYTGVHRRFSLRGRVGDIAVYDDYAHHPTEVRAVLIAARELAYASTGGRVIAVFQPHLYSRTATFAPEFAAALSIADYAIVLDVYGAREQPRDGISGRTIADAITTPVRYVPNMSEVASTAAGVARAGDVIVTLGAGDITMQGPEIIRALTQLGDGVRDGS